MTFHLWEINKMFYKHLEKYRNDNFKIYQLICWWKSGINITEIKDNRFVCEIASKKEQRLLEEINKSCFIRVINKRKKPEPLNSIYDDKIIFEVVVYKQFLYIIFFCK